MAQPTRDELRDLAARLNAYAEADASRESLGSNKTPTAFRWTSEMSAVFPVRLTMSQLTAMWEALHDAAEYSAVGASDELTDDTEGWNENTNGKYPKGLKDNTRVEVKFRNGTTDTDKIHAYVWDLDLTFSAITHWRLAK